MGLIFVVSTLCHIFDDIRYYLMPLYLLPAIFIILANKYIVLPRMGIVKFSKQRKRKSAIFITLITASLIILVTLTIFGKSNFIPAGIAARMTVSAIVFIICISIAFFLNFNRMYIYAFLITASFNLNEIIRENPGFISDGGYAYLFTAIVLIVVGGVYLYRFLKEYPLVVEEVSNDQ
jgi:hypothetical protein